MNYTHCDKCDRVLKTKEELKVHSVMVIDGHNYDLCDKCSEKFYAWLKTPVSGRYPWGEETEEKNEDNSEDISELRDEIMNTKLNENTLQYILFPLLDEGRRISYTNHKGTKVDYTLNHRRHAINNILRAGIKTLGQLCTMTYKEYTKLKGARTGMSKKTFNKVQKIANDYVRRQEMMVQRVAKAGIEIK